MLKLSFLSMVYQRYGIEKVFKEASRMGFNGLEIWGARPHAYVYDCDDATIDKIKQYSKEYNIEVSAYTPENCVYPYNLCSQSKKERKDTIEYYKVALDVAKQIDAPLIQITPGDPGYEGSEESDWGHLCEGLAEVCEHAEEVGVDVVMETLTPCESQILTTASDLRKLLRDVPSSRLFGMMDMVNPYVMRESFSNYFNLLGQKMGHIHIADSDGRTGAHLPLGDGEINFEPVISMIDRSTYQKYCSIEICGYIEDPETYMEKSIRYLRKCMEMCHVEQWNR